MWVLIIKTNCFLADLPLQNCIIIPLKKCVHYVLHIFQTMQNTNMKKNVLKAESCSYLHFAIKSTAVLHWNIETCRTNEKIHVLPASFDMSYIFFYNLAKQVITMRKGTGSEICFGAHKIWEKNHNNHTTSWMQKLY